MKDGPSRHLECGREWAGTQWQGGGRAPSTRPPSLHRNYPAATVLRAPPPSQSARHVSHELPVDPHQRLQRSPCLHRCSVCFRVERTSSRAGLTPAEDHHLSTAHAVSWSIRRLLEGPAPSRQQNKGNLRRPILPIAANLLVVVFACNAYKASIFGAFFRRADNLLKVASLTGRAKST